MKFFRMRSTEPLWLVQRGRRSGPYLNSPERWSDCGMIRAKDQQTAQTNAAFHVGSSRVRVSLVDAYDK